MKNYGIELNGIANMQLLLQLEVDKKKVSDNESVYQMNEETYKSLLEQLTYLREYMLAYRDAVNNETSQPYWHEVRDSLKQVKK